jgi:aspartate/tyrosine/aromatic aminotransferase
VVATILANSELRQLWQQEVAAKRERVTGLRQGLVDALALHGLAERFAHIAQQRGMFSYTGLTADQVLRLRREDSVYLVESGRANIAGLDAARLEQLAAAIARVAG